MTSIGISGPFILFTSLGFLWLVTWSYWVTNDPQDCSFISKHELRLIQAGKADSHANKGKLPPLSVLFSKLPTWAIIFANFTNNWGYFVLLSWMPVYFKTVSIIITLHFHRNFNNTRVRLVNMQATKTILRRKRMSQKFLHLISYK